MALNPPLVCDSFGLKKPVARNNEHFVLEMSDVHFEVEGPNSYFGWGSVFVSEVRIVLLWQPTPPGFESLEIRFEWLLPGSLRMGRHFMGSKYVTANMKLVPTHETAPASTVHLAAHSPGDCVSEFVDPTLHCKASFKIDTRDQNGDDDELFRILRGMYLKQRFEKVWAKMRRVAQNGEPRANQLKEGVAFYDPNHPQRLLLCEHVQ